MSPLILAVALVSQSAGQVVLLGRPGGLTDDEPALVAATSEELVAAVTAPSSPAALKARVKVQPFGTRAEILAPVRLTSKDAPDRVEGGFHIRIIDGADAGIKAYVRGAWIHPEPKTTARAQSSPRRRYAKYHEQYEAEVAANQEAMREAMAKAEADYKAALPFLLEAQRQQLERMSAMERNTALMRMAEANKRIADAIQHRTFVQGR
jgi:hypothetical protein